MGWLFVFLMIDNRIIFSTDFSHWNTLLVQSYQAIAQNEANNDWQAFYAWPMLAQINRTKAQNFFAEHLGKHPTSPFNTSLAWQIYRANEDKDFLSHIYPKIELQLTKRYELSFRASKNQDSAWKNPYLAYLSPHQDWVSPEAFAFLGQEIHCLQKMRHVLALPTNLIFAEWLQQVRATIHDLWHERHRSYYLHDWDTKTIPTYALLLEMESEEGLTAVSQPLSAQLPNPNRLLAQIQTKSPKQPVSITIEGISATGWWQSETVETFDWQGQRATAVGQTAWQFIDRVHIVSTLHNITHLRLETPNLGRENLALLLPLWAKMAEPNHAATLVQRTLTDPRRYWRLNGLPFCPSTDKAYSPNDEDGIGKVHPLWNTLIAQGLLAYGYRQQAADLFTRLMNAICQVYQVDHCFREAYHPDKIQGFGKQNALLGLPPSHLFLEIVGIRVVLPGKVYLEGWNPFPHPVTVQWGGVTITRQSGQGAPTAVTFPDGVKGEIIE